MVRAASGGLLLAFFMAGDAAAAPGDRDQSFAGDGVHTLQISGQVVQLNAVVPAPGGGSLATGHTGSPQRLLVTKLLPNGDPDTSFGTGQGRFTAALGATGDVRGRALAVNGAGVVTVAAETPSGVTVARYTAAGGPDNSFSTDGMVPAPGVPAGSQVLGLGLDTSGRALVGILVPAVQRP